MPSLFSWNNASLRMFSLFNQRNRYCAVVQGGVFFGIFMTASHALNNPNACLMEISHALTLLTLAYGALTENPSRWLRLLNILIGTSAGRKRIYDNFTNPGLSTLPIALGISVSALSLLGTIMPWCTTSSHPDEDKHNSDSIHPITDRPTTID